MAAVPNRQSQAVKVPANCHDSRDGYALPSSDENESLNGDDIT